MEPRERIDPIGRDHHMEAPRLQDQRHGLTDVEIVVHDETVPFRCLVQQMPPAARGKSIVNVDPSPGVLSTRMVPSCRQTMSLAIQRPRPSPPYARVAIACSNRWKMRF